MPNKKSKHGGDRIGSGRKLKYEKGVKTRSMQRIVPDDKYNEISNEVDKTIDRICGK